MLGTCRQSIYARCRTNLLGVWTLIRQPVSDESAPVSTNTDGQSLVHINLKCPSGVMLPITLVCNHPGSVLSRVLFQEIEKSTGIPPSLQMLTFGRHFLRPDAPLKCYQLQDGCVINLSVRGVGGSGSDTGKHP